MQIQLSVFMIMWDGIPTGADLVRRDGREWIKRSHAVDGERISIKHTYGNVMVKSCLARPSWTFAIYLRQLVDIFAAPPEPWETKQCEVMSLLRLIETSCRALWADRDLPSACATAAQMYSLCVHVSAAHTPSIKQDGGHVSSLEKTPKKALFFSAMDAICKLEVKRHSRRSCCCSQSLKKLFSKTNLHSRHLML